MSTSRRSDGRGAALLWGSAVIVGLCAGAWWLLSSPAPPPAGPSARPAPQPSPVSAPAPHIEAHEAPAPRAAPRSARPEVRPKHATERERIERALLSLPSQRGRFVIEVAQIARSPFGQSLLRCLPERERTTLQELHEQGLNFFEDFQTFFLVGDKAVALGDLEGIDWTGVLSEGLPNRAVPLGEDAVRYVAVHGPDQVFNEEDLKSGFILWEDRVFIGADSSAEAQEEVLARLRGAAFEEAPPALRPRGDLYGELPLSQFLTELPLGALPRFELAEHFEQKQARVELSAVVGTRAEVSLRFVGLNSEDRQLLSTFFGAAKANFAELPQGALRRLIEGLRLSTDGGDYLLDLPIDTALLRELLGDCVEEGVVAGSAEDRGEPTP